MRTRALLTAGELLAAAATVGVVVAAARSRKPLSHAAPPDPPDGLPPARLVAVQGHGELFVREAPGPGGTDAPTILLLHGWMFPSDLNWFTSYGPLSQVGRVIALDHRGHGRGTRPSTPFRLVDCADDAAALIRHLDAGPVIVVGYSMGGPIAQLLWQRHPELVRGMVLCATSATFSDSPRMRWVWKGMGALQLGLRILPRMWLESLAHKQAEGTLPIRITRMISSDTPGHLRDLFPWIISELDRGSAEDIAEAGRELGRHDARGWLGTVDVPTAVVITERDQLVPLRWQRDLAALIPGCATFSVPLDHDAPGAGADVFVPALIESVRTVVDHDPATPPHRHAAAT
jgi:pimeloyl-ACP methyl ester carboxylesterase